MNSNFSNKKIIIMHIDDSAVVRQVMAGIFSDKIIFDFESAADPIFAMRRMDKKWPDVIILDVEMPRMDGITFLKKIMADHPTPVVMCSSFTTKGAKKTIEALSLGAVDIITKPKSSVKSELLADNKTIVEIVLAAAKVMYTRKRVVLNTSASIRPSSQIKTNVPQNLSEGVSNKIIAIGTSTGGTLALEVVLKALPITIPGIVVVQHMPEKFTKPFADRLNMVCEVNVSEGVDGQRVEAGHVIISPGGKHLTINFRDNHYYIEVRDGPLVNRHKPSVDVLFRSVARIAKGNSLSIIMTGMGSDGAKGLKEIKESGGRTIGQDEETCVVYGMPCEAFKIGAVEKQMPLQNIAPEIVKFGLAEKY